LKRIVVSIVAAGVVVIAGLTVVGTAPASAKYRVGLGEQKTAMFDSPAWQSLSLERVRYAAVGAAQLRRREPPPDKLHGDDAAHGPRRGLADRDRRDRQATAEVHSLTDARRRADHGHVPDTRRRDMCSKITRLYVYAWFGEPASARFDAGLMNADGSPRKGFSVFRKNAA
jgi:hypothetical protein